MKAIKKLRRTLSLLAFFVAKSIKISRKYVFLSILNPLVMIINSYAYILFPALIINEITNSPEWKNISIYLALMLGIIIITRIIRSRIELSTNILNIELMNGFQAEINDKIMNLEFETLEDPAFLDLRSEVMASINQRQLIIRMINSVQGFISQAMNLISYGVLIIILNPFLIAAMVILVIINNLLNKKTKDINLKIEKMMIAFSRRVEYFESLTSDFKIGKDARIFDIKGMLEEEIDRFNNKTFKANKQSMRKTGILGGLMSINEQVQMLIVYSYIAFCVVKKLISIGDFTMYTGAAMQFGRSIYSMLDNVVDYRFIHYYVEKLHELLTYNDVKKSGKSEKSSVPQDDDIVIEFHNVSFKYPRSDEYTLKNINAKISKKEHISIIGENGAGKTTFIKLLCGLYKPTEGRITVNGVDISNFEQDEYRKLYSIVFQDFKLFACSVNENIAFDDEKGSDYIANALSKVGMAAKIQSLKNGGNTAVYKYFDMDGIEFSGGEEQKIALARAIYKDAPIVILDEPTAALDPYAEAEIFSKFNEITEDKSVVFISHRLSSCKLSDRILVFKNGEITQAGTHIDLIMDKGNSYYEMYMTQAQYYVTDS
jgi:ABC-type multidrug transport system fused ATPase/permease subunit